MNKLMVATILLGCLPLVSAELRAQDTIQDIVVVNRPKSNSPIQRKGQITEWSGAEITMEVNGRELSIDTDQVISFRTNWPLEYAEAQQLAAQGKTTAAVQKFAQAIETESRPWAQRIIRSKLISQLMLLRQVDQAADQFVAIASQDRNTRFIYLAPLAWSNTPNRFSRAKKWIDAEEPIVQLIGSSWALTGPDRDAAIARLEKLVDDLDARISSLAIAQIWRTRPSVSIKQADVWQKLVDEMPEAVRPGPIYVLAGFQALTGIQSETDKAIMNWMKVVSLSKEQSDLVSASLFESIKLLLKLGSTSDDPAFAKMKTSQANFLLNELRSRYPESQWAKQTKGW